MQPGGSKKWLGLIALACAACCAVPLAALLGIGGVTGMLGGLFAGVNLEVVLCLAILGALLVGGGYMLLRARKQKAQACATSCNADASCCDSKSSSSAG
jgi:membrane protein implicated in regulation of membrane protease activity